MFVYIHTYKHVYVCVYIRFSYVCMYTCIYLFFNEPTWIHLSHMQIRIQKHKISSASLKAPKLKTRRALSYNY